MGVEATIYILANHSRSTGTDGKCHVHHAFRLSRDKDLTGPLEEAVEKYKDVKWSYMQLPNGAWSHYAPFDGKPDKPRGYKDYEAGWLTEDNYGNALWSMKGKYLAEVEREEDGAFPDWDDSFNKAMFKLIVEHFPEHDVVVFFH